MSDGGVDAGGAGAGPPDPDDSAPAAAPAGPEHRPRIVDDSGIVGLSRVSRSRFGARVFTWFFVFVFALIVVQMIVALMTY